MLSKIIIFLCLIGSSYAFGPKLVKPKTNFLFAGDTKPMGFWDPLRITENLNEDQIKLLAEAEKHHGRIAMTAAVTLPILDMTTNDLAINTVNNLSDENQMALLAAFAVPEVYRMGKNYMNPFNGGRSFMLEKNVEPGDYLGTFPKDKNILDKELNNGRLAMIGTLGFIAQELVTQSKIF